MNDETKKQRGGARPGAGRKRIAGRDHTITLRVSDLAKHNLQSYASAHGISQQEAANRILEAITPASPQEYKKTAPRQ